MFLAALILAGATELKLLTRVNIPSYHAPMGRPRHPNKHIEAAVRYAEASGWRVERSKGHAWGHLLCPCATREGCIVSVWSTPRNPESHARNIRRNIDQCPHRPAREEEEGDEEKAAEGEGDG